MKRNIILLTVGVLAGLCLMTYSLMAETISNTGMSQKALVSFLTNVITIGNEVKSDHNSLFGSYTSNVKLMLTSKNYSTVKAGLAARTFPAASTTATALSLSGH